MPFVYFVVPFGLPLLIHSFFIHQKKFIPEELQVLVLYPFKIFLFLLQATSCASVFICTNHQEI